jgi:hypothetical protein
LTTSSITKPLTFESLPSVLTVNSFSGGKKLNNKIYQVPVSEDLDRCWTVGEFQRGMARFFIFLFELKTSRRIEEKHGARQWVRVPLVHRRETKLKTPTL